MRTGKLLKTKTIWIIKNVQPGRDVYIEAPAGTPVRWTGWTNEAREDSYGGRHLYGLDISIPNTYPEYFDRAEKIYSNIGAELGIDFEWDTDDN